MTSNVYGVNNVVVILLRTVIDDPSNPFSPESIFVLLLSGMIAIMLITCAVNFLFGDRETLEPDGSRLGEREVLVIPDSSPRGRRRYTQRRRERRSLYQVPSTCPSCGASINTEEVEWVGPLQAKCPYCKATVDAGEKIF